MYVQVKIFDKKNNTFKGKNYTYRTDLPLQIGDIVKAPFATGEYKAKVTAVEIAPQGLDPKKIKTITTLVPFEPATIDPAIVLPPLQPSQGGYLPPILPEPPLEWECTFPDELRIFRRIAKEFAHVTDYEVCEWFPAARTMSARRVFNRLLQDATAYMAAHMIWLANNAYDQSRGDLGIASISEDGGSMSYVPPVQPTAGEALAAIKESPYGKMWLSMRQPMIII